MPRILILTATMGEGHNTAARNVRDGITAETHGTCEVLVANPYTRTNPVINKLVQKGYNTAITKYPSAWKVIYALLSKKGFVEGMGPLLTELTTAINDLIKEFQPDIIASTYPVYSFLMAKIRRKNPACRIPFYTIITDSTLINSAWYRCPSDGSIVADIQTLHSMERAGVPGDTIHVLGFPVDASFEALEPAPAPNGRWKAILFPAGRIEHAIETLEALANIPNLDVSVITGRRRSIFRRLQEAGLPKHGELIGWADKMPRLMTTHHLFIGKAGGATVQEAIAAQIPFLVSHVVPGQEEGNISLIEQAGIGALATGAPQRIHDIVVGAMANDGALWHAWRHNLCALKKPSAARSIARFLLDRCPKA
ncbi:glycosyltransferase [soil metagenome]